jgi:hypothetical protein
MAATNSLHRRVAFALGSLIAIVLLAGLAEMFLRCFPPRDLHPYLGEASPLTGVYRPDADFGVTYQSFQAFCDANAERMRPFLPLRDHPDSRPLWAFFGSSFVQAPGMLGDVARDALPDRRIFYLGRNEPLFVRLAQLKLLLENSLEPERVFLVLMPVDMLSPGEQPLATLHVTSRGALTYEPRRPPGPAGSLVAHSRLALTAWARAGRHRGNPRFNKNTLYQGVEATLEEDLRTVFGNLARLTRPRGVPVTIILIPSYHQVLENAPLGFQDQMTKLLGALGYDVFDPSAAFKAHPTGQALYVPDKHLSAAGNQLLLSELLRHLGRQRQLARADREAP